MKNIAIFRRNGLGDLLVTYPLITYLKKENPLCHITLFLGEENAAMLPFLPLIDEVVVVPKQGNKYLNLLQAAWKKNEKKFDVAISAKTVPMKLMNLALFMTRAQERRAYIDHSWHGRLINHPILYNYEQTKRMHQALRCLHLVAPHFTELPEALYPKLELPPHLCKPYLSSFSSKPTIFISATTTQSENCFDSVRYAKLLNRLAKKKTFRVALIGMEKSAMRAQLISGYLDVEHQIYLTRSFEEFIAHIQLSDMLFIGDGGTAHIAAALGKPQLVLFGSSHPINWHPLNKKTLALYHPLHVNLLSDQKIFDALETVFFQIENASYPSYLSHRAD